MSRTRLYGHGHPIVTNSRTERDEPTKHDERDVFRKALQSTKALPTKAAITGLVPDRKSQKTKPLPMDSFRELLKSAQKKSDISGQLVASSPATAKTGKIYENLVNNGIIQRIGNPGKPSDNPSKPLDNDG